MFKLKNLLFVLPILMMAMFSLSSCSDDDDDKDQNPGSALVGTWVYSDDDIDEIYTFNADGTGVYSYEDEYDDDTIRFTWTATQNTVTVNESGDIYSCTYSINGNTLILDGDIYYRR